MSSADETTLSTLESLVQRLPDSEKTEFWFARDLQEVLGYSKWDNFQNVIKKAMDAAREVGDELDQHFRVVERDVPMPNGGVRPSQDLMLTRYACYLVAMNGDSRKPAIAYSQSYFAVQTRAQEVIEERIRLQERLEARGRLKESEKALSATMYERGVTGPGIGFIRSKGDAALFGGLDTQAMKERYGITGNRPLADFLPTLSIAAKNFANEMTKERVERGNLVGRAAIGNEHVGNNERVRKVLTDSGIKPEDLPAEPDLAALERKAAKDTKSLPKTVLPVEQ